MYPKGYFFDMNVYLMLNLTGISNNSTILSLAYLAFYAITHFGYFKLLFEQKMFILQRIRKSSTIVIYLYEIKQFRQQKIKFRLLKCAN